MPNPVILPDDIADIAPPAGGLLLVRLIDRYGPWAVLAAFLVWWMTNDISGNVRATRALLETHTLETNYYLRQVCINTAKDDAQRANCVQPQR